MNAVNPDCQFAISPTPESLLARSSLYREFVAEREEILRHKWFESQKAGRDIGFEEALVNWVVYHRAQWRKQRRLQSGSPVYDSTSYGLNRVGRVVGWGGSAEAI